MTASSAAGTRPGPGAETPRVLLVDPYIAREDPMERKFVELYPSLGLLSLASYLQEGGADVQIVDLTFARSVRPVRERIRSFRPHVVGVHAKTLTARRALEIAEDVRAAGAVPLAGGPDAASRPTLYLDGGFDGVALGEGEATLLEAADRAARGVSLAGTPGLAAQERGERTIGPSRPFLPSLDALPMPAWELIDMEAYLGHWQRRTGERRMAMLTSRGCPFDCSWCSKPTFGRSFRQMSPERVLRELAELQRRYSVDYVRFCDDVFGIQRSWIDALLDGLGSLSAPIRFECLARVDLLKPDLLKRMREVGLARVYLGVESGSQKMLDLMNRGTRRAQVERAAQSLRENGVRQFWFLMLGYPGETIEDIEETLALFRRFSPEEYSVSIAVPIPGTRFYDSVKDRLRPSRRRAGARSGGRTLLYEGTYPQALYRWTQARFDWEAALWKARGRVSPDLLRGLSEAADRLDRSLVGPLLRGGTDRGPAVPSPRDHVVPSVRERPARTE